jgi:hypothetical protein
LLHLICPRTRPIEDRNTWSEAVPPVCFRRNKVYNILHVSALLKYPSEQYRWIRLLYYFAHPFAHPAANTQRVWFFCYFCSLLLFFVQYCCTLLLLFSWLLLISFTYFCGL